MHVCVPSDMQEVVVWGLFSLVNKEPGPTTLFLRPWLVISTVYLGRYKYFLYE